MRKGFYGRRYGGSTYGFNKSYKELKFQTGRYNTNIDNNGFYQLSTPNGICMNGTQVGADVKQRIGRKIALKTLQLFCTVQCDAYNGIVPGTNYRSVQLDYTSPSVRILVFYDRQNNGKASGPSLSELFDSDMATTSIQNYGHFINCGKNLANTDRFLFLLDKTYTVDKMFSVDLSDPVKDQPAWTHKPIQKRFYINLKNLVTNYNGTGDTLSNINEGALHVLMLTNRSANETNGQTYVELSWRVRFTDH